MPVYEDTETQIVGRPVRPVVYLEPVPYEELEQRPHLPSDWREAISRVEGEPEYAPPTPSPPPPEPSWSDTLVEVLRGGAEQLAKPLMPLWDVGIRQGLNPLGSLQMRLGGALGWWPTLSELEQEMQTQAGVSVPAQQWLLDFYAAG